MKEYTSNKYKHIKMSAKVGNSRSNIIGTKSSKKVIDKSKRCTGCSRRAR